MSASVLPLPERIQVIRGLRVILDVDLAAIYGVETRVFNQAIKRNQDRFPLDFSFQLTADEKEEVITNCDHLARFTRPPFFVIPAKAGIQHHARKLDSGLRRNDDISGKAPIVHADFNEKPRKK